MIETSASMPAIILLLMYAIGLCFGSDGYMTVLNHEPSKAQNGRGFQCYTTPIDDGDILSYGRSYQIDNTDSLTDIPWSVTDGVIKYVTEEPAVAGGNVGVYYCKFEKDDITTIVQTTKIDSDAVITPANDKTSVSVNVGDNVTISFDVTGNVNRPFVWRKDGVEIANNDTESLTFNPVNINDAGMYEMHGTGQRNERKHSFINLIVRECLRHKWGPPDCAGDCQYCYNGGVCDDTTGLCICAPGFKGTTCDNDCGGNKFGWDCSSRCSKNGGAKSCRSNQFCLPEPYGCSCVTGYTAPDCLTTCSAGTFGAGCTQVCHCSSGTCNRYTGRCTGVDTSCQTQWTGSNCQECDNNYFGENCEQTVCPRPCMCSRTGICVTGTCHNGWLGPKCEIGIVGTSFTPSNDGQMTDIYCTVTLGSSSDIRAIVEIETGDVVVNKSFEENQGVASYGFVVLSATGTKYYCVIEQDGERAVIEIDVIVYQLPSYNGTLQVLKTNGSMIQVSWTKWNNVTNTGDGPIIGYILHYRNTNEEEDDDNWEQTSLINSLSAIVDGLQWETNYIIAVSAVREGEGGQGPIGEARVVAQTLCGQPYSVKDASLEILETGPNYIQVTWSEIETTPDVIKCSNMTYLYTVYLVMNYVVEQLYHGRSPSFQLEYSDDYIGSAIAVTVSNKDSESDVVELTINALQAKQNAGTPSNLAPVIGGGVGGVVFLCISLGLLYVLLIRRRRTDGSQQHEASKKTSKMELVSVDGDIEDSPADNVSTENLPTQSFDDDIQPYENVAKPAKFCRRIEASKLAQYVAKNKPDGLQKDYELLPSGKTHPWECAAQQCHKLRNRFKNIIPYDHSRVVLDSADGSDYYNASYINGYIERNHYIASQGPNKASVVDFWRMIWQKEINIIVMLTNVFEGQKEKCKQYWQENAETFFDINVCIDSEDVFDDYCIRTLSVWRLKSDEAHCRVVKQYHFTSWPDMGVPKFASGLLTFIKKVRSARSTSLVPTMVHCSAGVGRTGTYIVIDAMLDMIEAEESVDILKYLKDIRDDRINMVQTLDQYIFIHDALVEFYLNGIVQASISDFRGHLQQLKRLNPASKKTYIEEEFELLNCVTPSPDPELMKIGRNENNIKKNRFANILPIDSSRVLLTSDENYINASFLDGYQNSDRFIATQMPLVNTVDDLWKAVHDWKATTLVMLNPLDRSDPTCAQYWPENEGSFKEAGHLRIQLKSKEDRDHVAIRNFTIKSESNAEGGPTESIVKQYQVLDWPTGQDSPDRLETLLEVYEMVASNFRNTRNNPVIVHCINGIGRTGIYCTITETLDRMRRDDVIDIFQSVKRLRANRPGLVENLEQYTLCYDLVGAYLHRFATYSN